MYLFSSRENKFSFYNKNYYNKIIHIKVRMLNLSKDLVNALKSVVLDCNWQNVGKEEEFHYFKCYR